MTVPADTIAFAHRLADAAGEVIRPYFRQRIAVANKPMLVNGVAVFDPVTEADKNAEKAIRAIIDAERPDDGILGEEFGEKPGKNGLRWVLDPVDGTRAFINRHEGSLIALEDNLKPVLGVLEPWIGERFVGANGAAQLHYNGAVTPLHVRQWNCPTRSFALPIPTHQPANGPPSAACEEAHLTRWGAIVTSSAMALGCDVIVDTTFHPGTSRR